jgi:hypothetical protein
MRPAGGIFLEVLLPGLAQAGFRVAQADSWTGPSLAG